MKKAKKILVLVLSAMLLMSLSVVGTLAYLTSTTGVVENTFTVGNVQITLDEADVDLMGAYDGANGHDSRVLKNDYKLLPGHTYIKDPTVTVVKGSESAYIRMLVTVNNIDKLKEVFPNSVAADGTFLLQDFVSGWDSSIWVYEGCTAATNANGEAIANTVVYEFRYFEKVATITGNTPDANDKVLDDLFETITIPGDVDNSELAKLAGLKIDVVAHAIQADGFADADAAWAAWN